MLKEIGGFWGKAIASAICFLSIGGAKVKKAKNETRETGLSPRPLVLRQSCHDPSASARKLREPPVGMTVTGRAGKMAA
jgi:hypothetical protein